MPVTQEVAGSGPARIADANTGSSPVRTTRVRTTRDVYLELPQKVVVIAELSGDA